MAVGAGVALAVVPLFPPGDPRYLAVAGIALTLLLLRLWVFERKTLGYRAIAGGLALDLMGVIVGPRD